MVEVPTDQGRALVLQRVIRVLYTNPREADPLPRVVEFERLLMDLDAFERQAQRIGSRGLTLAMASNSSERDVLKDVLDTMGFRLRERRGAYTVETRDDASSVELRKRLDSAGIDTGLVETRLNAGEALTPGPEVIQLPSPLPIDAWTGIVFGRPMPPRSIFSAIVRDRQAALLLYGLQMMSPETRAFVLENQDLLRRMYRDTSGAVAAFGGSFQVDGRGRVLMPGGPDAADLWEAVAEERLDRPDRFARVWFERDTGRFAYFADSIARLDPAHQRFALGLWIADRGIRLDRFRALYRTFVSVEPRWPVSTHPYMRPLYDPATLLGVIAVGPQGDPGPPSFRRFWDRALDGVDLPGPGSRLLGRLAADEVVDAAWLVDKTLADVAGDRRAAVERVTFGQRVFATADAGELEDALVAIRSAGRFPALVRSLERMGIGRPGIYALAARRAQQIEDSGSNPAVLVLLAQFQGALALLDRLSKTGAIDRDGVAALVESLSTIPIDDARYGGALADWLERDLLALLPPVDADERPVEARLLAAMADGEGPPVRFEWEGASYVTDLRNSSRRQLMAVRAKQPGNSLDTVLELAKAVASLQDERLTLDTLRMREGLLKKVGPGIVAARPWPDRPDEVPDVKQHLERAVRDLARITKPKDVPRASRIARSLTDDVDYLLAEVLVGIVYTPSLGAPENLLGPGADVSHRHFFGLKSGPSVPVRLAWQRPSVDSRNVSGLNYAGSLLGLDLAMAPRRLRRLVSDKVPSPSPFNPNDRQTFVEALALLAPDQMSDEDLAAVGAAIAAGRQRIRDARTASALDDLAAEVRLGSARRQLLPWALQQEPDTVESLFSTSDAFALGAKGVTVSRLDVWGTSFSPLTGCFCQRFPETGDWDRLAGRPATGQLAVTVPDVTLRVAEHLAALKVPAALMYGVLAMAIQDYVDGVQPLFEDDWSGIVAPAARLDREQVEDYVASLVASGPVRAAEAEERTR